MKKGFWVNFIVTSISFYLLSLFFKGISFDNTLSILLTSLIFGLVNALIRPIFVILSLPFIFLTLGFFMFIINGFMLLIVSFVVPGFHVSSFWDAVFASLILSFISVLIKGVFVGKN